MSTIGLDLSLTATGVAVWDQENQRVTYTKVITTSKQSHPEDDERYWYITKKIMQVITEHNLQGIAIEAPAFQGMEKRPSELAGVVKVVLYRHGYDYILVAPNTLKKYATGNGRADKPEMVRWAQKFDPNITNHNIADALHLARYVAESVS